MSIQLIIYTVIIFVFAILLIIQKVYKNTIKGIIPVSVLLILQFLAIKGMESSNINTDIGSSIGSFIFCIFALLILINYLIVDNNAKILCTNCNTYNNSKRNTCYMCGKEIGKEVTL